MCRPPRPGAVVRLRVNGFGVRAVAAYNEAHRSPV